MLYHLSYRKANGKLSFGSPSFYLMNIMILSLKIFSPCLFHNFFFHYMCLCLFVQVDFSPSLQKLAHIVNSISSQLIKTMSGFKRLPDLLTRQHSQQKPIHSIIGTPFLHLIHHIPPTFTMYALFLFLFPHLHSIPNSYKFLLWDTKGEIMKNCMDPLSLYKILLLCSTE